MKSKNLKLVQLGVMANHNEKDQSQLLKYRSVAKVDPVTKKHWQAGLVLRENGRFEVYSDFMLVSEYLDYGKRQCVDIETDFNQFFLKFVVNPDLVNCTTEPDECHSTATGCTSRNSCDREECRSYR